MFKDGCLQRRRPRRVRKSTKQRKLELKEKRERKRRLSEDESEEEEDGYGLVLWRWREDDALEYLLVRSETQDGKFVWRPPCALVEDEEEGMEVAIQKAVRSVGASALSFRDDSSFEHLCKITRTPPKSEKVHEGTSTRRIKFFHAMVSGTPIDVKENEIEWLCVEEACERVRFPEWRQLIRASHEHISKRFCKTPFGVGHLIKTSGIRCVRCDWGDVFLGEQERKMNKKEKKRKPKKNTPVCKTFSQTGSCSYGSKCKFSHTKRVVQIPQTTFHLKKKRSKKKNLSCFACGSKTLSEQDFSKTQLLLDLNLRRCRSCIAKSKQGKSVESEEDPRTWNRDRIVRWARHECFTEAQAESIASYASRGHKLLQISGKALKNKIKGFRTSDSETAAEDRKRLRDLIEKLRASCVL